MLLDISKGSKVPTLGGYLCSSHRINTVAEVPSRAGPASMFCRKCTFRLIHALILDTADVWIIRVKNPEIGSQQPA
jgi:hypothetical protein